MHLRSGEPGFRPHIGMPRAMTSAWGGKSCEQYAARGFGGARGFSKVVWPGQVRCLLKLQCHYAHQIGEHSR